MRSFLLLLLSLMTGCEASSKVKGCEGGWVEFTCTYRKSSKRYEKVEVAKSKETLIKSNQKNVWDKQKRFSLYHDTEDRKLRVTIKQLQNKDSERYECKFYQRSPKEEKVEVEVQLDIEKDGCQRPFIQTAYRATKTTITCDYPGNKYKSSVKFFCKENDFICEDILSTKSSLKSNGTFTLTETNSGFNVSISDVSSHDTGVYWCGLEPKTGSYRAALRRIQLKVEDIITFRRSPTIGQNLTYWCTYPNGAPIKKFICKGEDPSVCQPLVSTAQPNSNTGRFSIKEVKEKRNITITVREITADDTGTYWCGAASTDGTNSNPFYHRFLMTVVSTSATPTSPVSSTPSTTASDESDGGFVNTIIVIVCVAVLLLLLVVILILICRRFSHSKTRRDTTAAAQQIRQEYVYEEIADCVQSPDSGNAVTTIYATANFPTNPSASLQYATINFQNSSNKAGGEALILKPRPNCDYSTVMYNPSPIYSTVNEPSRPSQDPVYSTVNKPQAQCGKISSGRNL